MGAGFIRRFNFVPSDAVIGAIEGVVILDRNPPASIQGVGTGLVLLVAEFEDGPFNTVVQLGSSSDLQGQFGGFGYAYGGGLPGSNPCARSRKADGAVVPEFWNGNGYIATFGKTFGGLAVVRVNTSVGNVQLTALASVSGGPDFSFALTSGQHLDVDIGAGPVTATFTGAAATITSGSGTYPSTFAGGEQITFVIDGVTYQAFFLSTDQSHTQVIARMNLAAGFIAFAASSTATVLTGLVAGTSGNVQIVSLTTLVATATGFSAGASVAGTGNVPNLRSISVANANTVVSGAVAGTTVDRDANGDIRITNTATPGTGTIKVASTSTALAFGFPLGLQDSAVPSANTTIPAGTVVQNSGGTSWVLMQTVQVVAGNAGPYLTPVRPALDDGSVGSAGVGTVNVFPNPVPGGNWSVVNPLALTAALSEAAIDAAYVTAINATLSLRSIAKRTNVIISARQSNLIRTALGSNVQAASSGGSNGRTTCVSPPLGTTTRAAALSTTATPGVGAYRSDRLDYVYPGVNVQVPAIAAVGLAGGAGFSATGKIDVHADTWLASVLSNIAPEENPGQLTNFLGNVLDVEQGNPDVQNLMIGDYENFKNAGIVAINFDDGDKFFQSGITSVDPTVNFNLRNIARRRMADFIEDSLAPVLNAYAKQLSTLALQGAILGAVDGFMLGLLSPNNPSAQRIAGYSLDGKTLNTPTSLAAGLFKIRLLVRTLSSMDTIVLDCQIGETVVIQQAA